ncbi:hypothetical protein BDU57DRAFT_519892 [Ampelomyces quisqualis]|uniref:Uncharacterized protein n=1 Tax=Ampelomyces quisqualis TaxID=50730 RepID=A0A6A5QIS3_AMPQU|nr:hypothetical protein BDU57DRAFT_519892 [Ampelomyces quisqualis]
MAAIPPGVDPWTIPCEPPPQGLTSNFYNKSSLLDLTVAVVVLVLSSMAITMTLRFWVMHTSRDAWEPWKMDDCAVIGTFVLAIAQGVMQCFQTKNLGFDAWDLPLGRLLSSQTQQVRADCHRAGRSL